MRTHPTVVTADAVVRGPRSDRLSPVKGMGRWQGPEEAGSVFFGKLAADSGAEPELFSSLFLHRKRSNVLADHGWLGKATSPRCRGRKFLIQTASGSGGSGG